VTTRDFLGIFLYFVVFIPIVYIPPHKLQRFLYPSVFMVTVAMFGILGWAMHANGGPGNLIQPAVKLSHADTAFHMVQGICNIASSWTGSAVRGSDWTRYSKSRSAPILSQLLTPPITITICALIGVLVTSATLEMYGLQYGYVMWNPLQMLQYVQSNQYTAACRAGTFFVGLAVLSSQLFVSYPRYYHVPGLMVLGQHNTEYYLVRHGPCRACSQVYLNASRWVNYGCLRTHCSAMEILHTSNCLHHSGFVIRSVHCTDRRYSDRRFLDCT
jgi:Permease for cytosine/purines, uracil, thiamine, allantoin